MIQIESNNYYRVRDIYEAAYLYASGCKFSFLEKSQNFYYFVFTNKDASLILRDEYWQGLGQIQPKLYADSIKFLKQRIFEEHRGNSYVH